MRGLAGFILVAVLAGPTAGLAQELVTSGERAAAPTSAAPKPLVPKEQLARDDANAQWAQNILDGKPNISEDEARQAQIACPPADTPAHGEVRVAVGSGGYKSTGFTMVKPISGCGVVAVSVDMTDGGNQGRRFRRR